MKDTALTRALFREQFNEAQTLINRGANVNARGGSWGYTPLFTALGSDKDEANPIVKLLIDQGADVNASEYDQQTPLIRAASRGRLAALEALVHAGAKLEAKDQNGDTALSHAAAFGRLEVAQTLLKYGSKIDSENRLGWTPLMQAAFNGRDQIVSLLLSNGANIHHQALELLRTPLLVAAASGIPSIVKQLLDNGADALQRDALGLSARDYATLEGCASITALLPLPREPVGNNGEPLPFWQRLWLRDPVGSQWCKICADVPVSFSHRVDGWEADYKKYFFRILRPVFEGPFFGEREKICNKKSLYQCPHCHQYTLKEMVEDTEELVPSYQLFFSKIDPETARAFVKPFGREDCLMPGQISSSG